MINKEGVESIIRNKRLLKIANIITKNKIISNIFVLVLSIFLGINNIYAVNKIEGGNVTIDSLANIIKNLAVKIQVFGIVLAFISLVIFVIQFIIGDDETKQKRKKTILYTLGGVVILILAPSLINVIIDTLG